MYDELIKRIHRQAVYLPEKFSKNAELLDVLMKAADAIEELSKPRWIPVTERLPEESDLRQRIAGNDLPRAETAALAGQNHGRMCGDGGRYGIKTRGE